MQNNIRKYIKIHFEKKYPVVEGLKIDKKQHLLLL